MRTQELLERLSHGPFSNLSIGNDGDGTIKPDKIAAIIGYANDGLTRLYTRFTLSEKELILELKEEITSYRLHSKYAYSKFVVGQTFEPYILDADHDKFEDDLIRVLTVHRTGHGRLPLNDTGVIGSLYTPMVDVLQVPDPWPGVPLFVTYQAKHPKLLVGGISTSEIDLPTVLEDALMSYVAHKAFSFMNGKEHVSRAADLLSAYENICAEVKEHDLVSASLSNTNTKFQSRGFV